MSRYNMLLVVGLAAALTSSCRRHKDEPVDVSECTDLDWNNFASGFLSTWCGACHSNTLTGEARYGAPDGMDFNSYDQTAIFANLIRDSAAVSDRMPPGGGPSDEDRSMLLEWLDCEMPGAPPPSDPGCDREPALRQGDLVIDGSTDIAALCTEITGVTGDLEIQGDVSLDCLCEVGGDLRITADASTVSLSNLVSVGGLQIEAASLLEEIELGELRQIGSNGLHLVDNPLLVNLELDELDSVEGDLSVTGNSSLYRLFVPKLVTIGGDFTASSNPALLRLDIGWITTVGGSLVIANNETLSVIAGDFEGIETLGGDFVISNNDSLPTLYGFLYATAIGGDLVVTDNDGIYEVFGFDDLPAVPGRLVISGNSSCTAIHGFENLASVGSTFEVSNNPQLTALYGFELLTGAGIDGSEDAGIYIFANESLPSFEIFDALTEASRIDIHDNPQLSTLPLFEALQTISGPVQIVNNSSLAQINLFPLVESLPGDLEVSGNTSLQAFGGLPLLHQIGGLHITDNPSLGNLPLGSTLNAVTGDIELTGNDLPSLPLWPLAAVGGDLTLSKDPSLASLGGLSQLESVGGSLQISELASLTLLTEINALETVASKLIVTDNPSLPTQEAYDLRDRIDTIGGEIIISGNL